jgi:hypothetical protein
MSCKGKRVFWVCISFFIVSIIWNPTVVYSASKILSPEKQKEFCLAILAQISEIDREAAMAGDKLKEAARGKSTQEIIVLAEAARDAAKNARDAYERLQLDMPDGLKKETESALNDSAYYMKTAYAMYFAIYRNFAEALRRNENAELDISRTGEIYTNFGEAIQAEAKAKASVGIKE